MFVIFIYIYIYLTSSHHLNLIITHYLIHKKKVFLNILQNDEKKGAQQCNKSQ